MKTLILLLLLLVAKSVVAEDKLYLYNWNNYLPDTVVQRFQSYCRCTLVQDFYGDNEEMLAKLAAGAKGYDLVVPTGFAVQALLNQHKALLLDKSQLPNLKNLKPEFMNNFFDKGNQYSIPYAITTTLIGYNETKLKQLGLLSHANSWALIFDPTILAKIAGKVTVLDSQRELIAAALMYLGKSPSSTKPSDWSAAREVILKAKPYWAAFNSQSYIKELTVGNIYAAFGYSNDMYQAQQDTKAAGRDFTINFQLQKEGNTLSIDNFVVLQDAPHKNLAYKFINFMLEGENAAELSNNIGSGNPNQAAMKYIRPELTHVAAIFPPMNALSKLQQLQDLNVKQRRELNKIWSEIKLR